MSDANGNLLFYTDGINVYDPNGTITAGGLLGSVTSTQSAIIVPDPMDINQNQYYIFTTASLAGNNGLRYSIYNALTQNFVPGSFNVQLNPGQVYTEKLCAIEKNNDGGYWIVAHQFNNNIFDVYDLSCGLNTTPIPSSVGANHEGSTINAMGHMKFNRAGNRLAVAVTYGNDLNTSWTNSFGFVQIFDFDLSAGVVSNPMSIGLNGNVDDFSQTSNSGTLHTPYGLEFSNNGTFLYISELGNSWSANDNGINYSPRIFQVDITSSTGPSLIPVAFSSFNNAPTQYLFGALQMGRDRRLYYAVNGCSFLGVIDNPNILWAGAPINIVSQYNNGNFSNCFDLQPSGGISNLGLPDFVDRIERVIPNVDAGADQVVCEYIGASLTPINATSSNNSYQWLNGNTQLNNPGPATSVNVLPINNTTYTLQASDNLGCLFQDYVNVIVEPGAWHQTTKNASDDNINDVITDAQGNVYVVGTFKYKTTINGGGSNDITLINNNSLPMSLHKTTTFIAKYDPCGSLLWASNANSQKENVGHSITINETTQKIYIAGYYSTDIEFLSANNTVTASTTISSCDIEGYVAQYDAATGTVSYVNSVHVPNSLNSTSGFTECRAIAIDEVSGEIYVGGRRGSDPATLNTTNNNSSYGYFVNKYNPSGNSINLPMWSKYHTAYSNKDQVNDMDYDEINGNIWVTGKMKKRLKHNNQWLSGGFQQDGFIGAFVGGTGASLSVGGIKSWRSGGVSSQGLMEGNGVSIDEITGIPYFIGSYKDYTLTNPFKLKLSNSFWNGTSGSLSNDNLPGFSNNFRAYFMKVDIYNAEAWCAYGRASISFPTFTSHDVFGTGISVKNKRVNFCGDTHAKRTQFIRSGGGAPVNLVTPNPGDESNVFTGAFNVSGQNILYKNIAYGIKNIRSKSITTDENGHAFVVGQYIHNLKVRNGNNPFSWWLNAPNSGVLNSSGPVSPLGPGNNGFILRGMLSNGYLKQADAEIIEEQEEIEEDISINFSVYPNPFDSKMTIHATNDREVNYLFAIYDARGNCVRASEEITTPLYEFNMNNIPSGMYFIKIHSDSGVKVIKTIKK